MKAKTKTTGGKMNGTGLVKYDTMCRAIAACHKVDEVLEIRNKAKALEVYAKIALDEEEERRVRAVRVRAERRAAELYRENQKLGLQAKQGQPKKNNLGRDEVKPKTLEELGISYDQSSQWQELADIPEEQFEEAIADQSEMPSTESILRKNRPKEQPPTFDTRMLFVIGLLDDFHRVQPNGKCMLEEDPGVAVAAMVEAQVNHYAGMVPKVVEWLTRLEKEIQNAKRNPQ